jgi:hypothetical protein
VSVQYSLDGGQPYADALEFFVGMKPLENSEQFVGIPHVKADTIVTDKEDGFFIAHFGPYVDL